MGEPWKAFLTQSDGVAVSFWIISIAIIAATVFFFAEASTVKDHWRTSLHVGGLVTLVAGVHYMYMREYWVQLHKSPVVPIHRLEHHCASADDRVQPHLEGCQE